MCRQHEWKNCSALSQSSELLNEGKIHNRHLTTGCITPCYLTVSLFSIQNQRIQRTFKQHFQIVFLRRHTSPSVIILPSWWMVRSLPVQHWHGWTSGRSSHASCVQLSPGHRLGDGADAVTAANGRLEVGDAAVVLRR